MTEAVILQNQSIDLQSLSNHVLINTAVYININKNSNKFHFQNTFSITNILIFRWRLILNNTLFAIIVTEILKKSKFLLYVLYSCYMKFHFCCLFTFITYLFVYYMFFKFCYIFLFSHYLVLNLFDVFIFIICTKFS